MKKNSLSKKLPNERVQSTNRLDKVGAKRTEFPPLNKKQPNVQKQIHRQENHIDEALNNLIHEYLIKNNYLETLEVFQAEYYKPSKKKEQNFFEEILNAFDKGNRQLFFLKFNKFTPVHIRLKDQKTNKLQFYLQIYFLVYNIHPGVNPNNVKKKFIIDNPSKQAFQNYLQSRGAALAKTSEFLHFYALAYIQKPHQNNTFKHIFTKQWIIELRERLVQFLQYLYPQQKTPVLVQIYQKFINNTLSEQNKELIPIVQHTEPTNKVQQQQQTTRFNNNIQNLQQIQKQEIAKLEVQKNRLLQFIEGVSKKYQYLQDNYKQFAQGAKNTLMESQAKWFQITQQFFHISSDLLKISERLKQGIPLDNQQILEKIKKKVIKYQTFVNTNIQDLIAQNIDFSLFERPSVSAENQQNQDMSISRHQQKSFYENRTPLIQLDFKKIHETLMSQNTTQIALVLQALRWRITKTRGIFAKRQVVVVCAKNDVIGIHKNQKNKLLRKLLHSDPKVTWQAVQLINSIAGDYYGRSYLLTEYFTQNMIQVMLKQKSETNVRKILLSVLQKISLRRFAQLWMIENNLIKWIINILKNERQSISVFSLEYITALLMNLSLRKEGLEKCQQIKQQVLKCLIDLLESQISEVRTFVHGTLYAVLSRKSFRMKARQHGLGQLIKYLMQNSPQAYLNQLRYLQKLIEINQDQQNQLQGQQVDSDNDIDDIQQQPLGDQFMGQQGQNQIIQINGKLTGEPLLIKEYALTGPDIIHQMNQIYDQVQASLKKRENSIIRNSNNQNSFDRPISQNKSIVRSMIKKNGMNNNSSYSQTGSNRMLPSEVRQRKLIKTPMNQATRQSRQYVAESLEQVINKPISPISPQIQRPPLKEYEKIPEYKEAFQTRSKLVRTPPRK